MAGLDSQCRGDIAFCIVISRVPNHSTVADVPPRISLFRVVPSCCHFRIRAITVPFAESDTLAHCPERTQSIREHQTQHTHILALCSTTASFKLWFSRSGASCNWAARKTRYGQPESGEERNYQMSEKQHRGLLSANRHSNPDDHRHYGVNTSTRDGPPPTL